MKIQINYIIQYSLLIIIIIYLIWSHFQTPEIAFVNSGEIIEQYIGMKEARDLFQTKIDSWETTLETKQNEYEAMIREYKKQGLDASAKKVYEEQIHNIKQNIEKLVLEINEKSITEEENITQGALNQINQFIEDYSKRKHIQIVLGVTLSGNILYGADKINITNELISELNKNYKGIDD